MTAESQGSPDLFSAALSRLELRLIKTLSDMVVQIGIVDDCRRNRFVSEHLCLDDPLMPCRGCEMPLTNAHQRIQFSTRGRRQRGDRLAQSRDL